MILKVVFSICNQGVACHLVRVYTKPYSSFWVSSGGIEEKITVQKHMGIPQAKYKLKHLRWKENQAKHHPAKMDIKTN
jgi:hypothetical protein